MRIDHSNVFDLKRWSKQNVKTSKWKSYGLTLALIIRVHKFNIKITQNTKTSNFYFFNSLFKNLLNDPLRALSPLFWEYTSRSRSWFIMHRQGVENGEWAHLTSASPCQELSLSVLTLASSVLGKDEVNEHLSIFKKLWKANNKVAKHPHL
jgi:hypothetical protein